MQAQAWQAILGVSEWVMTTIRRGYTLQFPRRPPRFCGMLATTVCSEDAQILRAEVIKVVPHPRRFLRFALEGVAYQYKVLPFGLSLVDAALSPLRQMGICILNYLDDWLILAQSEAVSTLHKTLLSHLCFLGLRVNFAKSILSTSQ